MKTITEDIIIQIRANYLGSDFVMILNSGEYKTSKLTVGMLTLFNKEDFLLLNSLENITDEDAIECLRIREKLDGDLDFINAKVTSRGKNSVGFTVSYEKYADTQKWIVFSDRMTTAGYQYLQSKGYALPYIQYSVKDLIELGVYKLKTK